MIRLNETACLLGSVLLVSFSSTLTYLYQQRVPIASLHAEIYALKQQINNPQLDGVSKDHQLPRGGFSPLPNNRALAELRGTTTTNFHTTNEEKEGGEWSPWKPKAIRKLYQYLYSHHSGPTEQNVDSPTSEGGGSDDNLEEFLRDLVSEIEGLAEETENLDLLTKELDTIASFLDPDRRQLSTYAYGHHNSQSSGGSSNGEATGEDDNNDLNGQMDASLEELETQKRFLSESNGHMTELNVALHDSVLNSINLNRDLSNRNDALQGNVDNLSSEVDRLQNERNRLLRQIGGLEEDVGGLLDTLDEHERLNDQLRSSIQELNRQNQDLENSNTDYANLNNRLNESIAELQAQNQILAEQNEIYTGLNTQLDTTADRLSGEVDRLSGEVDDLETQNNRLSNLVDSLNDEIGTLSDLNDNLNETVQELGSEVDRLTGENDRLEGLVDELGSIASFLNETAVDVDESLEDVTEFLADQIAAYRAVVLETLQNTYIQRVANWDCSFRDVFRDQDFIRNGAIPIAPRNVYNQVINYIDDRILSNLCLDTDDFETYLDSRFNDSPTTTMNHLISGVEGYTTEALNYYFPDEGEFGLAVEEWASAGYACENLPENQQFQFVVSNIAK